MRKEVSTCEWGLSDRFFDQESGPDEHARIKAHLRDCASCQKTLRENRSLSALFAAAFDQAAARAPLEGLEDRILGHIRNSNERQPFSNFQFQIPRLTKKLLIPVAAIAGIFLVIFSLSQSPVPVSGPSAIVSSFTGDDISSVMILETPESRQTIIWFNENSEDNNYETQNIHPIPVARHPGRGTGPVCLGRA